MNTLPYPTFGANMSSQLLSILASDGGGSFQGYLSLPSSGKGPGLILIQEIFGVNENIRKTADLFAEEGYVVLAPDIFWRQDPGLQMGYTPEERQKGIGLMNRLDEGQTLADIQSAITTLRDNPVVVGKVGVLGFCMGGKLAYLSACRTDADAAVGYYGVGLEHYLGESLRCPLTLHIAANDAMVPPAIQQTIQRGLAGNPLATIHVYPGVDHAFARFSGANYHKPSAILAHDRSVQALKAVMGPHFNLSKLWDKHCEYEFATRDVDATMATMVAEPYVNHIPTMTGGVGHRHLAHFYKNFFVNSNPPDTNLIPISRTVGATQVVDELLFCFTHTCEVPWMLPGVKPTGKRVEIPLVAVVKFRGDKLCHEHIYWDQASVLVQIGLLDPEKLPVAGIETARKVLDESLASNTLMNR